MKLPQTPWQKSDLVEVGEMWVSDSEHIKLKHQPTENSLVMLNLKTNQAIYWVNDATTLPYYESSAPLRLIMHWWVGSRGGQLLHAASVGKKDKGLLLIGQGGSGKSNTAISCLDSDLNYISDDYCLLENGDTPLVHGLYSTAKLYYDDVARNPFLQNAECANQETVQTDDKALYFLHPAFHNKLLVSAPIKAVVLPKVTGKFGASYSPISSSKAYLALAPSTIFQMHGNRQKTHENVVKLLRKVPSFELELSTNRQENVQAMSDLLNEL